MKENGGDELIDFRRCYQADVFDADEEDFFIDIAYQNLVYSRALYIRRP